MASDAPIVAFQAPALALLDIYKRLWAAIGRLPQEIQADADSIQCVLKEFKTNREPSEGLVIAFRGLVRNATYDLKRWLKEIEESLCVRPSSVSAISSQPAAGDQFGLIQDCKVTGIESQSGYSTFLPLN